MTRGTYTLCQEGPAKVYVPAFIWSLGGNHEKDDLFDHGQAFSVRKYRNKDQEYNALYQLHHLR